MTGTYTYDAFGAIRTQTGSSANEFKFTGEQVDSTGMEYLRARYYDQATGRFLSRDPLRFMQRYAYVWNNPVGLVDPYGLGCRGPDWRCDAQDVVTETAGDALGGAASGAQWTYDNVVEPAAEWTYDEVVMCVIEEGGPTACVNARIYAGLNYLATMIACAADKESYFDAGGAVPIPDVPGGLILVGGQVSCRQGLHPYLGLGGGTPGFSVTTGHDQQIAEGLSCGFQASEWIAGQVGMGGGLDESIPYNEIGGGTPGANLGCLWIW